MTTASTPSESQRAWNASQCSGDTDKHHPFLGLGDPDFGVGQPFVFQRRGVQRDLGADVFTHFAHGAREPAGAAIGDGVVQSLIACHQHDVQQHLLGDGIADLDGAARDRLALARQFRRTERGPVDPVTSGAAADGDDVVAGLRMLARLVARQDAHGAAEDERIAQVTRIEIDRSVDRWGCPSGCRSRARRRPRPASRDADAARRAAAWSSGVSGGAKQNTSVLHTGLAPRPVPSGSRITPPMPVFAPPYGSRADG